MKFYLISGKGHIFTSTRNLVLQNPYNQKSPNSKLIFLRFIKQQSVYGRNPILLNLRYGQISDVVCTRNMDRSSGRVENSVF